jgi:hypothetical protein
VYQDLAAHSTQQFDFVITQEAWLSLSETIGRDIHWDNYGPRTFLVTNEGVTQQDLEGKLRTFCKLKMTSLRLNYYR